MESECGVAGANWALMRLPLYLDDRGIRRRPLTKFDRHRFPISAYWTLVDPLFVTDAI